MLSTFLASILCFWLFVLDNMRNTGVNHNSSSSPVGIVHSTVGNLDSLRLPSIDQAVYIPGTISVRRTLFRWFWYHTPKLVLVSLLWLTLVGTYVYVQDRRSTDPSYDVLSGLDASMKVGYDGTLWWA